jgi:hypothetical protein
MKSRVRQDGASASRKGMKTFVASRLGDEIAPKILQPPILAQSENCDVEVRERCE